MKVVADSGSTKTSWGCILDNGDVVRFTSKGYNPAYLSEEEMVTDMTAVFPSSLRREAVSEVYFYGAGILPLLEPLMGNVLRRVFPQVSTVVAKSDLIGACKALLGGGRGFIAILGTGMNTCVYDGEKVAHRVSSLGFILGDEGSGAYIGRNLLRGYLRKELSLDTCRRIKNFLQMTDDEIIRKVYKEPMPNRFCASLCKVIDEEAIQHDDICLLVRAAFEDFFRNVVSHYENYQEYVFNAVGSVAFVFKDILRDVLQEKGMQIGIILRDPLDGLIDYYKKK